MLNNKYNYALLDQYNSVSITYGPWFCDKFSDCYLVAMCMDWFWCHIVPVAKSRLYPTRLLQHSNCHFT